MKHLHVNYWMCKFFLIFIDWGENCLYHQCSEGQQVMEAPRSDCRCICRGLVAAGAGPVGYSSHPLTPPLCTHLCRGTTSCHRGYREEGTLSLKAQEDRHKLDMSSRYISLYFVYRDLCSKKIIHICSLINLPKCQNHCSQPY